MIKSVLVGAFRFCFFDENNMTNTLLLVSLLSLFPALVFAADLETSRSAKPDSRMNDGVVDFIVTSAPPATAPIAITTSSLPAAIEGRTYCHPMDAAGGTGPLSWRLSSGNLPGGLSFSNAGIIFGTPGPDANLSSPFSVAISVVDSSSPANSHTRHYSLAVSAATGVRTINILAIGDSITHGGRTDPGHEDEWTYRLPLQRMLLERGIAFDFVGTRTKGRDEGAVWPDPIPGIPFDPDHEAQYGAKTAVARDYLRTDLPQFDPPDIVLIHLGTNNQGDPQNHGIGHVEAIVDPLRQIICILRQRNPNIVILLGHLNFNHGNALLIRPLVEALAVEENTICSPVVTVHHYLGFNADPNHPEADTYDWAHPNPSGQEKMARHWFDALIPHLNIPDSLTITTNGLPDAVGERCPGQVD